MEKKIEIIVLIMIVIITCVISSWYAALYHGIGFIVPTHDLSQILNLHRRPDHCRPNQLPKSAPAS